jgi:hypothetical protein
VIAISTGGSATAIAGKIFNAGTAFSSFLENNAVAFETCTTPVVGGAVVQSSLGFLTRIGSVMGGVNLGVFAATMINVPDLAMVQVPRLQSGVGGWCNQSLDFNSGASGLPPGWTTFAHVHSYSNAVPGFYSGRVEGRPTDTGFRIG